MAGSRGPSKVSSVNWAVGDSDPGPLDVDSLALSLDRGEASRGKSGFGHEEIGREPGSRSGERDHVRMPLMWVAGVLLCLQVSCGHSVACLRSPQGPSPAEMAPGRRPAGARDGARQEPVSSQNPLP